jgi:hypothetical protein
MDMNSTRITADTRRSSKKYDSRRAKEEGTRGNPGQVAGLMLEEMEMDEDDDSITAYKPPKARSPEGKAPICRQTTPSDEAVSNEAVTVEKETKVGEGFES